MKCEYCGVEDALGRHDGTCARAIELGLPRLSDGEDPIEMFEEGPVVVPEPELGPIETWPEPREPRRVAKKSELWLAYSTQGDTFDAVIFDSELEALRHAVQATMRVIPLELGRDLRGQIDG